MTKDLMMEVKSIYVIKNDNKERLNVQLESNDGTYLDYSLDVAFKDTIILGSLVKVSFSNEYISDNSWNIIGLSRNKFNKTIIDLVDENNVVNYSIETYNEDLINICKILAKINITILA